LGNPERMLHSAKAPRREPRQRRKQNRVDA
jgi:hypothetical protein